MHAVETFEIVLALLAVVVALQWAARRLGLPPATALLIGGGGLAFVPGLPPMRLDPEFVLVFFLPPLLMDGAYYTALGRFRRHLPGILSLAVGAVVFTTLAVGLAAHWLVPSLPWTACFALGAILSPPDAVSARAVLGDVALPRRLSALLEGESLLNDATGLVLFRFAVAATLSGTFSAGAALGSFALLAAGGVAVGFAVARLWLVIFRRLGEETLEIAATATLCWFAYLAGEALHVSGVIATVTAGLVMGWQQHVVFKAAGRLRGTAFWRTLVFVLEALVFILIGFSLRGAAERLGGAGVSAAGLAGPVGGIILMLAVARFAWVFGVDALLALAARAGVRAARPLGWRQAGVLGWAGMRGVVTLAIALTLPAAMPGRDLMLVAAFAAIFATVVVQGTSLGWVIRRLAPRDADPPAALDLAHAEAAVARARLATVREVAYAADGTLLHPHMLAQAEQRARSTERYAADAARFMVGFRSHFDLVLRSVAAGRAELIRLHRAGEIEDETLHDLERDLDVEELGIILQRGS